jgi:hypothetical protein
MIQRPLLAAAALVLPLLAMAPAAAAVDTRTDHTAAVYTVPGSDGRHGAKSITVDPTTQRVYATKPVPGVSGVFDLPYAVGLAPTTAPSRSSNPSSGPAPGHGSSGSGIGWGLIAIVAAAVLAFTLGSRLRRRGRHKDQGGDDLSWTG